MFQQFKKGIDEYLEEIEEIVDFMKNPEKYEKIGAEIPKGILMVGKPGVGKTLLAKALANESDCYFIYVGSSSVISMYSGGGAKKIREIFKEASQYKGAIIFFDEFDSIASKRDAVDQSYSQDENSIINELLTQMDGFQQNKKIFVVAATNFPESLDPAVVRPGRFDKILKIPQPSLQGRKKIIEHYLKKIKHDENLDVDNLASLSVDFTGSDIKTWVNLSILNAIKNKRKKAEMKDFDYGLDRMNIGIVNKSLRITEQEKFMTAVHEAGHALVSLLNENAFPMNKVTILSKGGSLGHTSFKPKRDFYFMTKEQILAQLDVAMGGRVAEEIFFGNDQITTGCGSDLNQATQNVYRMIGQFSMGDFLMTQDFRYYSEYFRNWIDEQAQNQLKQSYLRTKNILLENKAVILKFANKLVEEETMDAKSVKEYLNL